MTIGNNRLVLFLSFCRINDLDTALNHIFPLPTGDIFSNRMVWFEDKQIPLGNRDHARRRTGALEHPAAAVGG